MAPARRYWAITGWLPWVCLRLPVVVGVVASKWLLTDHPLTFQYP